jgi:hypothetical protein
MRTPVAEAGYATTRRNGSAPAGHVVLELREGDWSALEVEPVHQNVPLERLLEHAALLFLAEIDAGRMAIRVVEAEE